MLVSLKGFLKYTTGPRPKSQCRIESTSDSLKHDLFQRGTAVMIRKHDACML